MYIKKRIFIADLFLFIPMDILPIPEQWYLLNGILKFAVAMIGIVLFGLTLQKHLQKKSRISMLLLLIFIFLPLGMLFASFDDLIGWDALLGPETWVGFGLAQIFNGLANSTYFALYLEIFIVKDYWEKKPKIILLSFSLLDISAAFLVMGHYSFNFMINVIIPSGIHVLLALTLYILWIITSSKTLSRLEEEQYRIRFRYFQICAIFLLLTVLAFATSSLSSNPSFATWFGIAFLLAGLVYTYKAFLAS